MNGTAIGVGAALLLGGTAAYGGYVAIEGRGDASRVAEAASEPDIRRVADEANGAREPLAERGRRGAPTSAGADAFSEGAAGEDVTDAVRAREAGAEADREAARLALLDRDEAELNVGRPRGLRGAGDDTQADEGADVERLLADIAARDRRTNEATGGTVRVAAADRFTPNRRVTDKPDAGGFTANRRLTDKPDQGGFVASADTQRLDPCLKADGTAYVGPGTALNAFTEGDPCLPRATAQGYEVASATPAPVPPLLQADPAATPPLAAVDVARPFLTPPPPVGTGSDYRG